MKTIMLSLAVMFMVNITTGQNQLSVVNDTNVVGIPSGYKLYILSKCLELKLDDGSSYYVIVLEKTSPEYVEEYAATLKVFIGFGDRLFETKIFTAELYRDGGSLIIQTKSGPVYFPSCHRRKDTNEKPSHNFFEELVVLYPKGR